ncbi:DNA polymerase III subunit gamma/tau [Neolewinella antarctica]|uniref:DNA polymerase III subunit gamma/tau n=1 Tax=Neolewinella antarctica TaxID=442734 RepID=A0ABX0X8W4_9BACT|nr:DNA polymerase III subunit gamma/tau [Neolewinella antarctica]NJC25379.1 DNA polymerase-3 subunit gamma/tau [Neolewinella antarctica]
MSKFVVSARKYRPVKFDEVVGQQHVSQTLKNALQTDHLAHAFLFCGPRGVGKTTSARILAKVLNCTDRSADYEPCNECSSCVAFNNNASLNITELDAASNNSVDHIRALTEQVRFTPQEGEYKVFIIDEVHMLSQAAFNAFLKTLEEPPPYAIFILATTEKHKIIPTILSRCQVFDFKRIQPKDIITHLQDICQQEGIEAEDDALHIIAQKADGALRDALSIFDRIVSFSGKSITYDAVIENLNVLDYDYFFRAVDFVLTEDRAGMMLLFDDVLKKGFDEDLFLNGLAAHVRDLLVCKEVKTLKLLEVGERLRDRYQQQALISPADLLLTILQICNECDLGFRLARNKRLHVEMSLLKATSVRRAFRSIGVAGPAAAALPENLASTTAPEKKSPEATRTVAASGVAGGEPVEDAEIDPTLDAPAPKLTKATGFATVDLMAMQANIEEELAAPVIDDSPELNETNFTEAWTDFTKENAGSTLALMMGQTKADLEGEEVVVRVGSQRVLASLRDNNSLINFLRDRFGNPALAMRLEVDKSMQIKTAAIKKRLTAKDKFLAMREKNPEIDDLRKIFDLRPEE